MKKLNYDFESIEIVGVTHDNLLVFTDSLPEPLKKVIVEEMVK